MDAPKEEPERNYHRYDSDPMPWWLALLWLCFFAVAPGYGQILQARHCHHLQNNNNYSTDTLCQKLALYSKRLGRT